MVEVRVLGPLRLQRDGSFVRLGSGKQRLILATLAASRGRPVSADALLIALWGEAHSPGALGTLQSHVSRLRTALGDPTLLDHGPNGYALDIARIEMDALRFERVASAEPGLADRETLRSALDLWQGLPYGDLGLTPELEADRARLIELRWALTERLVAADLDVGRHVELLPELDRLVREEPLREATYAQLMVALYRAGRQGDALDVYRRLRRVLRDELGVDPTPALQQLERAVLAQSPSLDLGTVAQAPGKRRGLPVTATTFVGREEELKLVRSLVETGPLVTLVGAGGSGKTRLAYELAESFPAAVLVELAALSDAPLLRAAIADAVGITTPADAEAPVRAVAAALVARGAVLVLDNAEHILPAVTEIVSQLLAVDSRVKLLITSRSPLRLPTERLFMLPPLNVPTGDAMASLAGVPAADLFLERAQIVNPGFLLDERSAKAVARVCRAVDGLPLALELAAGALATIGLTELANRVAKGLGLLDSGSGRPERHRTMQAALNWSHQLLARDERLLLDRIAAFPGLFSAPLAEQVCSDADLPSGQVLPALRGLAAASLVELNQDGSYRMLETIRAFAVERARSEDLARTQDRLVAAVGALARQLPRSPADAEYDDAIAALDAAADTVGAVLGALLTAGNRARAEELLGDVWWWWYVRGRLMEGAIWASRILEDGVELGAERQDSALRALNGAAFLAYARGDYAVAQRWAERAVLLADAAVDARDAATSHMVRGLVARYRGDLPTARESVERTLIIYRHLGDDGGIAHALGDLGDIALRSGDLDTAWDNFEGSLLAARPIDDRWATARALLLLAEVAARRGATTEVELLAAEAAELASSLGDRRTSAWALRLLGDAKIEQGEIQGGRVDLERALAICVEVGDRLGIAQRLESLAAALPADLALEAIGAADVLRDALAGVRDPREDAARTRRLASANGQLGVGAEACLRRGRLASLDAVVQRVLNAPDAGMGDSAVPG